MLLLCKPACLIFGFHSKSFFSIVALRIRYLFESVYRNFCIKAFFRVRVTLLLCESAGPSSNFDPKSIFTAIADMHFL